MQSALNLNMGEPLALANLMLNLGIGAVLSLLLRWHFKRFASTLTNREEIAQVFPLIVLTTVLIISVVKSSLALSLGLVGALSIVRFRTAIKEPEELSYLFISIAIGLGLGAGQTVPTVVAGVSIMAIVTAIRWVRRGAGEKNLYLTIDWKQDGKDAQGGYLERLNEVLAKHVKSGDLRRFDTREESAEATYVIGLRSARELGPLVDELRRAFPSAGVTFLDHRNLPSV
jgi:uncharacterized membrane protein YhiD involved in acid resistance